MNMKPIKTMSINAPKLNSCTAEHFVKFILLPQYRGMCETWPKYNINLTILLYKDSEEMEFFDRVNYHLKRLCPELLGKYILERRS